MLSTINAFFDKYLKSTDAQSAADPHRTRVAAATLLVEVIQADSEIADAERRTLTASIGAKFELTDTEAKDLLALAEDKAHHAVDLHQFTSLINRDFSPEQKRWLIEELWRAAYADEVLHRYEDNVIRRIADLIYVPPREMLAAKHRAQTSD
jgi:uncharacterized tellurite resistance protein B-like protein